MGGKVNLFYLAWGFGVSPPEKNMFELSLRVLRPILSGKLNEMGSFYIERTRALFKGVTSFFLALL